LLLPRHDGCLSVGRAVAEEQAEEEPAGFPRFHHDSTDAGGGAGKERGDEAVELDDASKGHQPLTTIAEAGLCQNKGPAAGE
jgi:hypothetical protein